MRNERFPSIFTEFDTFFRPMTTDYFLDEDASSYTLSIDMPGIKKTNLEIQVQEGVLTVKAESKDGQRTRQYNKVLRIPDMVKTEEIEAELNDGILKLKLPKLEKVKPKLIQIK